MFGSNGGRPIAVVQEDRRPHLKAAVLPAWHGFDLLWQLFDVCHLPSLYRWQAFWQRFLPRGVSSRSPARMRDNRRAFFSPGLHNPRGRETGRPEIGQR